MENNKDPKTGRFAKGNSGRAILHGAARRGAKRSPEYISWERMKQRCRNPNVQNYRHYGGRGITVCERWLTVDGFLNFLEDMGKKPTLKHTIDRIDTNGNYEPSNCRWATVKEQNENRRKRVGFDMGGIMLKAKAGDVIPISEIAKILGINPQTIVSRYQSGWTLRKALTTPRSKSNGEPSALLTSPASKKDIEVEQESELSDLIRLRNYFGENDKTEFEHWAYNFLSGIISRAKLFQAVRDKTKK